MVQYVLCIERIHLLLNYLQAAHELTLDTTKKTLFQKVRPCKLEGPLLQSQQAGQSTASGRKEEPQMERTFHSHKPRDANNFVNTQQ